MFQNKKRKIFASYPQREINYLIKKITLTIITCEGGVEDTEKSASTNLMFYDDHMFYFCVV